MLSLDEDAALVGLGHIELHFVGVASNGERAIRVVPSTFKDTDLEKWDCPPLRAFRPHVLKYRRRSQKKAARGFFRCLAWPPSGQLDFAGAGALISWGQPLGTPLRGRFVSRFRATVL